MSAGFGHVIVGVPCAAVPVSVIDSGLSAALSVTVRDAERAPATVGWNFTLIVQAALPSTDVPQLSVSEKSPLFVPVIAMLVILSVTAFVTESVTDCGSLWDPTACDVNIRFGASVIVGIT